MNTDFLVQRSRILEQMAALDMMEEGSLKAEYRNSTAGGAVHQVGPYYKHQVWREGRNVSQRISAQEAASLEQSIANRQQFKNLADQFVEVTIAHTRQAHGEHSQKKSFLPSSLPKSRKSKNS
jgi:hypothetical protein